jgi:hypothetical protein
MIHLSPLASFMLLLAVLAVAGAGVWALFTPWCPNGHRLRLDKFNRCRVCGFQESRWEL